MKALSIFSLIFLSQLSMASTALDSIFEKGWTSLYEQGKCGENSGRLVKAASEGGLDLEKGEIIHIKNRGVTWFGMVSASQARRRNTNYPPERRNWYFHAIFVYQGYVYDFDFTNSATVMPVNEYFQTNFLDGETEKTVKSKLKYYELTVISAKDYLAGKGPWDKFEKLSLAQYLERN